MSSRRKRILTALDCGTPDKLPKDLGAMGSTGISCFAYPALVDALDLPPRPPRVFDTGQMLAVPDRDVLDALDCDVITVTQDACTNAFDEPERWRPYDFGGRLDALVMNPDAFSVEPDGTVVQKRGGSISRMPPRSHVFDTEHAGQAFDLAAEPERTDLTSLAKRLESNTPESEAVERIVAYCRRAREATDRAIMFSGLTAGLGFPGGIPDWSILCMSDPGYVGEYHDIVTTHTANMAARLAPLLAPYVDVLMLSADDQGLQTGPILPPDTFGELYVPFYRRVNDAVHTSAPGLKTFLHSCGAIYELIDHVIEAGFDALNPVQWSAGGHGWLEWKDRARGKLCLWGGGVNTQSTLPLGSVSEVEEEVSAAVSDLAADGGYVFCAIHNILAEIEPEKVIAMYRTAANV